MSLPLPEADDPLGFLRYLAGQICEALIDMSDPAITESQLQKSDTHSFLPAPNPSQNYEFSASRPGAAHKRTRGQRGACGLRRCAGEAARAGRCFRAAVAILPAA